eukprot:CAMPEP_0117012098 /NCGR_PEP_ID=MMETSP0472-20121206/10258_1 /TAXON_ID=693140 ORGANISM="Tiarina fusus, Strain LIS" /NCGR_SAMPLE_ID=MMETSP0472 /ASSEMBLY_ACC=CAM_ASM_000603 /LENGTH=313 /DNA_ID=CAMNT_0004715087 /DNA_START=147 /DNA_END=1088 /DNA_ORIENTATION=+
MTMQCMNGDESSSSSSSCDDVVATVRGMRHRERQYMPLDYINMHQSQGPPQTVCCETTPLDEECRMKMSLWCAQIIEHCSFQQETCVIAMNSLDRFLSATPWACEDRSAFQLAAITSLYTAIKVHEPQAIAISSMAGLTRGVFTAEQIEGMERVILEANRWLVHPPTTFAYGHLFCEIIARADPKYEYETLYDLTKLQLEASIHNYEIALSLPSEVAFAAVMNAAEGMALVSSPLRLKNLEDLLASVASIDASSSTVQSIEKTLYEGIVGVGACAPSHSSCHQTDESACKGWGQGENGLPTSPRSVSAVKAHN